MDILAENNIYKRAKNRPIFVIFVLSLVILSSLSIHFLKPKEIQGDGISYSESMNVLKGGAITVGFIPNRVITTFLGLETVIFLSKIFGSITTGWILMNLLFYFVINIFFYKIIFYLFKSDKVALVSSLFFASNYALLTFGLNYLMDIGGWTFYICSIFYSLKYLDSHKRRDILISSILSGIGGLFKEYALLSIIPIAVILIYENKRSLFNLIKNSIFPAIFAIGPLLIIYIFAYSKFHYSYLDWFGANKTYYVYHSRIVEYIKSLGVLVNVLGFLCLGGLTVIIKKWKEIDKKIKLLIVLIAFSILPIFFWPAITERILFITIPFGIIIASFFVKEYEKYFYWFMPILTIYILASFFMDSIILQYINLPF